MCVTYINCYSDYFWRIFCGSGECLIFISLGWEILLFIKFLFSYLAFSSIMVVYLSSTYLPQTISIWKLLIHLLVHLVRSLNPCFRWASSLCLVSGADSVLVSKHLSMCFTTCWGRSHFHVFSFLYSAFYFHIWLFHMKINTTWTSKYLPNSFYHFMSAYQNILPFFFRGWGGTYQAFLK